MNTPIVSVIVPVYNAEKHIHMLIDSILAQTFHNFELLLIDDESTDGVTAKICDEYGAMDSRIRVFHKPNGGVSDSRNFGIERARGEFITFADHDDYMFPDNLETMVKEIGGLDLLICDYNTGLRDEIAICKRKPKTWEVTANKQDEMAETIIKIGYKNAPVWNQLFRRSIIDAHKIRFRKIQYEDELFSTLYLIHVNSVKRIDYSGYYWIQTQNSQGSSHRYIAEMDWIKQMEGLYEKLISKYSIQGKYLHTYNWRVSNRLAVLCLKGYYKDSQKPYNERMAVWRSVRNDGWLKGKINLSVLDWKTRTILIIAKYRFYYIFDPLFTIYGRLNS